MPTASVRRKSGPTVKTDGTARQPPAPPDEMPYIDDPASKWWVGIIIAVFAVIFAGVLLSEGRHAEPNQAAP